jgi:hypothetical protein
MSEAEIGERTKKQNWIRVTIETSTADGDRVDGVHRVSYQSFGDNETEALGKLGDTLGFVMASLSCPRPIEDLARAAEYLVSTGNAKPLKRAEEMFHDAALKVIEFWDAHDASDGGEEQQGDA